VFSKLDLLALHTPKSTAEDLILSLERFFTLIFTLVRFFIPPYFVVELLLVISASGEALYLSIPTSSSPSSLAEPLFFNPAESISTLL